MTVYLFSESLQYYFGLFGLSGAAVAPTSTCCWGGRCFPSPRYLVLWVGEGSLKPWAKEASLAMRLFWYGFLCLWMMEYISLAGQLL